jgi:hypothetical protein
VKRQAGKRTGTDQCCTSISKLSTVTAAINVLPNGINVCERSIMLPGHSEVSLAATMLCRLQLFTVLGSSASELCGIWNCKVHIQKICSLHCGILSTVVRLDVAENSNLWDVTLCSCVNGS